MTMVIIPYTRNSWRIHAYIGFILTAWWVQSWAWFSITGLLLADMVMIMHYKERARHGIKIWKTSKYCPTWVPCMLLMSAGLIMQFLSTAWRPQNENKELVAHTGLYYSGGLNTRVSPKEPQARDEDYLLHLGFFLLMEYSDFVQRILRNRLFLYLGKRSLSKLHGHSKRNMLEYDKRLTNTSMQVGSSFRASSSILPASRHLCICRSRDIGLWKLRESLAWFSA